MQADIADRREALAELCRRYGVKRLEVFGSAARGTDFDPDRSDVDFLVEFEQGGDLTPRDRFLGLAEALERLMGRPVDLVERNAVETSRNYIRRRAILRARRNGLWLSCHLTPFVLAQTDQNPRIPLRLVLAICLRLS